MSILSEAWRRAHGGDARFAKTLGAPAVSLRSRPPLLPWLLCGLLVALVVGLGVYIWLDQTRAPREAPVLAPTSVANPVKPVQTGPQPSVVAAPVVKPAAALPKLQQPVPAGGRHDVVTRSGPVSSPPVTNTEQQTHRQAPAREAAGSNEASAPALPRLAPKAEATPATAPPPSQPIELNAAPNAIRLAFPSLDIGVHVWNADPASRFIMIGSRQFHAGDELAPGVRLLKITRGGEVVGFRGYRLVLP